MYIYSSKLYSIVSHIVVYIYINGSLLALCYICYIHVYILIIVVYDGVTFECRIYINMDMNDIIFMYMYIVLCTGN